MTGKHVMDRAAAKRHATMQSLRLFDAYPRLQAWLSDLFTTNDIYSEEAFEAESRLTTKGLAIEYAIVWPWHSVRCTVDVLPTATPDKRTARSIQLIGPFHDSFQQLIALDLMNGQAQPMLRYGAWVGVREERDSLKTKLYLEVIPTRKPGFFETLGVAYDRLASFGVRPVMVGLPIDKGGVEVYFRLARLDRPFLTWLLTHFGFPDRTQAVFTRLEELCDSRLSGSLEWSSLGCSISWSRERTVESVTVYSFASSAIGSDARVRKNVMRLGKAHNWDMSLYDKLSLEATGITDLNTFHGMIGVVAGLTGDVHFTTGISPVSSDLV